MGLQDNIPKPGARFTVQYNKAHGYAVYSPSGVRVGVWFETKAGATVSCSHEQRKADAAAKRVIRPCLCCRTEFQSEGFHNRLCGRCRGAGDMMGEPHRPYITREGA